MKDKIKSFQKKSGTLIPISFKKNIPFKVKRIFFILGEKNFIRGDHAHKKCSQFLIPILGKINVSIENKNGIIKKNLDYKKKEGYLLKPLTWCKIKFLSKNSILMVACDMEYDFKDYIEKYKDFKKQISK
jgi:hypothetical protein